MFDWLNFEQVESKYSVLRYLFLIGDQRWTTVNSWWTIKKNITIPIITGYKKNISKVLDIEYRVTKIYSLFTSANLIKKEYQIKPIIKENND